jgi:hypothetical protein
MLLRELIFPRVSLHRTGDTRYVRVWLENHRQGLGGGPSEESLAIATVLLRVFDDEKQ